MIQLARLIAAIAIATATAGHPTPPSMHAKEQTARRLVACARTAQANNAATLAALAAGRIPVEDARLAYYQNVLGMHQCRADVLTASK